jgi:Holliday junction resolvasome RuvABC endonuclease subunit
MVLALSEIPKPDDAADALAIAYLTWLKYWW